MAEYKLFLPSMGEGVMEASITKWLRKEGDFFSEEDSLVEIATDKVDSEVPAPVSGRLSKVLKFEGDVVPIGGVLALLEVDVQQDQQGQQEDFVFDGQDREEPSISECLDVASLEALQGEVSTERGFSSTELPYLSPLVKSIVLEEGISQQELDSIRPTGAENRITKEDILALVRTRKAGGKLQCSAPSGVCSDFPETGGDPSPVAAEGDEIVQMDRMRKIIAQNMLLSKRTAAHVTSFIESDVSTIVQWREENKGSFLAREGLKLTYMPVFIHAVVKAIQDFPMINIAVDGDQMIKRKNINIGIAVALPDGNLIVPVIKNADRLSISGLAKAIYDLSKRSREKKLKPQETQGATYTVSNIGTFGNLMGTPIIPQPQVAILAVGSIVKKPAVLETAQGDVIAIRHKMFLSHSYDHRVVDGLLGGMFLKQLKDYLEEFDPQTQV